MSRTEIGTIVALIVATATGALYIGHMNGTVEGLGVGAIRAERDAAVEEIRAEARSLGTFFDQQHEDGWILRVAQGGGVYERPLIRIEEGICFITGLQGKFERYGEHVWIEPVLDHWLLRGTSEQPGVEVSARCWRFPGVPASAEDA